VNVLRSFGLVLFCIKTVQSGSEKSAVRSASWRYEPWRGVCYPDGLKQDDELAYASRALTSIELNGSFYTLQNPESCAKWYGAAPKDFILSIKGNRFIIHVKRLREIYWPANVLGGPGESRSGAVARSPAMRR
jgi:uncharacterized protein YecE (DUF72 family)